MYSRLFRPPNNKSFFLFGPRGTGKSSWVREHFKEALYFDLLESDIYTELLASPQRLDSKIPPSYRGWIIIDEVKKIPALLDEVHRLIERRQLLFALTGSSARKLKQKGVNLLAGRALTLHLHPLTARELGEDFDVKYSLLHGQLPSAYTEEDPQAYLKSYIAAYLKEEIQQEGLTRNLGAFTRFLEAASYSQASVLNVSAVARDAHVERKVVEGYFSILEDLLLAARLPVFSKKAKRRLITHQKFYFFDAGVYRAIRPKGPLDTPEETDGAALETLVFQELRAMNDYFSLGYTLHYWRAASGTEVDFVLYGERGILAIEVKRSSHIRYEDSQSLRDFLQDYPMAEAYLLYTGTQTRQEGKIKILPLATFLRSMPDVFPSSSPIP